MDFQGALRARLLAAPSVTAVVAQRVAWVERPQGGALPAITLQVISDPRPQHFTGFQDLRATRVQVDVWGDDYGDVTSGAEAAIAALGPAATSNGISFDRSFVDDIGDLGEQTETAFIFRKRIDFIVHHQAQ
jgi:hypothetical protein